MIIMHRVRIRMVASQLNIQIILLLKRPPTHYWSSPLKCFKLKKLKYDQIYYFSPIAVVLGSKILQKIMINE